MGYDNAGNLTWSAGGLPAATGCHDTGLIPAIQPSRVARAYNNRNLLTSLSFPDGMGNQGWTYTPDGLPDVVTTYNSTGGSTVTNAYSYNKRRMLVGEAMTRGTGTPWSIGYGYDGNGSASTLVYPSGLTISFAPNALGQPTQAGSYATGVQYYPNGAIKQFSYGNGIVHTMTQNARQLPSRSTDCTLSGTCATANRRLDLAYGYDEHGNVGQITDHVNGRQTRGMAYDDLDRLTQTTSAMFGTASYTYDVLDNLLTTNVMAGSNSRNHTYVYEASSNRLTQIKQTVGGAVVANLGYDVRGNLASKGTQTYQFDYGNRLRSVPGKEAGYQYDAQGRRVYGSTTGSSYIVSQYSQAGVLLYQQDYKQAKRLEYVYLGGSLVAFRETPHGTSTSVVKYQHTDALGTPIAVTDAAKAIIETSEYEPYGQLVNSTLKDGPGFTGHVLDAATGLTYMQQRYYDPTIGRFLSVDPVTALSSPLGMFNRYKYAANNPYRFVDPDGRSPCSGSMCGHPGIQQSAVQGGLTEEQSNGAMATYQANRALKKEGAVRPYDSKEELHKTWGSIVEPISKRWKTEIASHVFKIRGTDKLIFGQAFSSGQRTGADGFFNIRMLVGHDPVGFIHTHPNNFIFSGEGLSVNGLGEMRCSSNCDGDILAALTLHRYAALVHGGSVKTFDYEGFSELIRGQIGFVPVKDSINEE